MTIDSDQAPMELALAVDLGGTKVETALVDSEGTLVPGSRHREPTGPDCTPALLDRALETAVARTIAALPAGAELRGAGIGAAGPVDATAGTVAPLNLPHLSGYPLAAAVARLVAAPVRLALDGTCITLAEHAFGAARGVDDVVCMVVSTGIGGGLVSQGRVVVAAGGNAGHIGQVRVRERRAEEPPEAGTLEAVASGPSAVRWARAQGWAGATGEELAAAARAGERVPRAAIERSAAAVGECLAGLSALLGFERVVIGGGFSASADDYIDLVQAAAQSAAILPSARALRIRRAELGGEAPLVGASRLVFASVAA